MSGSDGQRRSASFLQQGRPRRKIHVYDCRSKHTTGRWLEASGLDLNGFRLLLQKTFAISPHEAFVLTTTDRTLLDFDKFKELQDGSTMLLLHQKNQALSVATEEHIKFVPHYDTLIKSGLYEYYASEGQNSLPYALAELIDNALSATAKNTGARTIEIRMMFDETLGKPAVIVLDNGCGMTTKQLTNWAVYRLSKFSRENSTLASEKEKYVRPAPAPRSLNSDISYFGVGGKQAAFYIGESTRMISKPADSPDVHELILSKQDFERKERNNEDVYSGTIINRMPGNSSHIKNDGERFLHALINEEKGEGKESFTAVVITGVHPEHITFLKQDYDVWTRQLAHIYHYYVHGVNGNDMGSSCANLVHHPKIDIQITLREKPPRCPRVIILKEIDNDMQTLYINAAKDTFEFKASAEQDSGTVEGVIRYHPFLFDKETYPQTHNAVQGCHEEDDDDDNNESGVMHQARGKRPIFECFWNGRLIPYTTVSEFDWCTWVKGKSKLPPECYNRISGVLFSDDRFQVSTNKLTFMDLELKLKKKDTIFTRVVNGQAQRGNIQKEFTQWLQNCHLKLDKQIQFLSYKETITRMDVPTKKMQHPWATFSSIEWDGRVYRKGQLVKSQKTNPILHGTVVKFLLYGDYKENVFATGGQVQLTLEPKALYNETKTIAISKIDQSATNEDIQKNINNDLARLPEKLQVDWPDGNPWPLNAVRPAGTVIGPLKVEILNKKGESLSRMPSVGQGPVKKLIIELKVIKHGPKQEQELISCIAHHSAKWGFWFRKNELTQLGKYTLFLNTAINESNATFFGDRALPSYKLHFTIKEGCAGSFVIGTVTSSLHVGVPFDIPLQIKDAYDHATVAPPDVKPVLNCSGLELSYEKVDSSGTTFIIRGVKARGKVLNYQQSKPYDLKVTLPGLQQDTQSINIVLLPGKPHSIHVTPQDNPILTENRKPVTFDVKIHDEAGNITPHPKQIVRCQIQKYPLETTDCSTGAGQLVTKPINLKIINGEPQMLRVQFEMPSQKNVALVVRELKVLPSTGVSSMELYCEDDENLVMKNEEKIKWMAGGLLENMFYRLYDEAHREVPLTAEIASKIKVNWTADVNQNDLIRGKLPDIQVPKQVQDARFCLVSYQDQSVSVGFNIVPRPDEPKRLKVTLPQNTVKLGGTLPGNITLELVDQYDNATKTLNSTCVNHMSVEAEGLTKSAIVFKWQESSSSVLVTGVQFQSGALGPREMCFTYENYVERVIVKVTAGVPARIKLVSGPEKPLQVLNGSSIDTPFLVQLCDMWENPSPDQRVVVELRCSPSTLKMATSVTSQPVDAEGKASFTVISVNGAKGYYQLEFIGSFNMSPILGPSVNLTVIPNPNTPVSLSVAYDARAEFPAGGTFPVFSVTVVSDEGSPMTTFNPAAVSMFVWKGTSAGQMPPPMATEMRCSRPMANEKNDRFHFRDKEIPENVGKHTIQFSLRVDKTDVLYSDQITVSVVANQPVKLGPDSQPTAPVVSYTKDISRRSLVENMTLRIMDAYGNPAGQELNGKLRVSIKNLSEENNKQLPLFEGKTSSFQFRLVNGKAHIPRLAIMENSPGEDGSTYILLFKPEMLMVSTLLEPFGLPFHFCNDEEKQQKMSSQTKKKEELTTRIAAFKEIFAMNSELLELLTNSHLAASAKEADQRKELIKINVELPQPVSIPSIDRLITEKRTEANRILEMPRRVCSIRDNFKGQQDVLGMVGHLALVQDDNAARVICWQISGDMDCIITRTITAAQTIYDNTQGRQQVMALDSIYVPPGNRPLPHIRNGHALFKPVGNPVFARELLIYPENQENCDLVFKTLLGDIILMDDLHSANNYRKMVVQSKTRCPTILTRQGERISAIGKFGGTQNRAPPINTLKVFGAPLPEHYNTLKKEIDLLTNYRSTLEKKDNAAMEREEHVKRMKSPENIKNQQEMQKLERQLEEIECVPSPGRPVKRGPVEAGELSGIFAKRAKQ